MTEEQIIKALECCVGGGKCKEIGCPFRDSCMEDLDALQKHSLDLIKSQRAENERLQIRIGELIRQYNNDIGKAKNEAIKEFAEKITEIFMRYAHLHSYAESARKDFIEAADGAEIEMQSVWDVLTLKKYEMSEYEEMNRLQKNIEIIEKERLLTELENDFRLLVKEMESDKNV